MKTPKRTSRLVLCSLLLLIGAGPGWGEIVIKKRAAKTKTSPAPGIVVPPPAGGATVSHEDKLEFLNGDRLLGTFLALDPRGGARWQHPAIRQVLTVRRESIARIVLDRPGATNSRPNQTCGVRLTNDDQLVGELVALDEEHLSLNTWFAGAIKIPRNRVASLLPGKAQTSAIYEGPDSAEGWRVSGSRVGAGAAGPSWQFSNGAFVSSSSGAIGRNLNLPGKSNIEFDVSRRGYLQFAVCIYSTTLERYGGDSYMLQFNNTSVYMQRMTRNGGSSSLGNVQIPALGQQLTSHISIRSDKETKTVSLLVDGTLAKQWVDRGDFPEGTSLVFVQQAQGVVRLSDIRVTEWDGKFDNPESTPAGSDEDFIQLANNDKISGTVKVIKDGKMSLSTEFATLDVPMERVARIDMAYVKAERSEPTGNDVRAVFADQGSITFALERWDDRQVVGTSPNFGRIKMTPIAFTELEFNLTEPRAAGSEADLDGDLILSE